MKFARVLPYEGGVNFRDLGGYVTRDGQTLRWGKLYRCGKLDDLSAQAIDEIAALGIKTKIDLRYPDEVQMYPSSSAAFPKAENIVWQAVDDKSHSILKGSQKAKERGGQDGLRTLMKDRYVMYLKSHAPIFSQMLRKIANAQTPLVFHCAAGKDRTGVAAAIILSLLDVDRDTILQDYMITQEQLGAKLESWALGGASIDSQYLAFMDMVNNAPYETIKPLFDADESYLKHCFSHIDSQYGGFESYAKNELGLTASLLEQIKAHLLEPSAD